MNIKLLNEIFGYTTIFLIIVFLIIIIRKNIIKKNIKYENHLKNINAKNAKHLSFIKNNWYYIAFVLLFILAIFTRTYKIDTLLNGFHVDEAGMSYDAFCIANYGVDRYLNNFPLYMINFGGGQSALYTYLTAIVIKFIGLNVFAIRLPGIILSLLAIISGFILIKKSHSTKCGLFFMFLMIICPWHVMQSRFGLDCNLLSSMIIISITLLILSKKWWHYLLAGISFGLTLYTYALSYLIVPILLFLSLIYMLYTKKIKFVNIIILGIPIAILSIPLILMLLINIGCFEQINWIITIPKLPLFRGEELAFNNILGNLNLFKNILTSGGFIYNSIPQFGTLYLFAVPLAISGIIISIIETVKSIINKKFNISAIMIFLFIANIILICLTQININKVNSIYISLLYFIFITIKYIYKNFKIGFLCIAIMYIIMSFLFFKYYYNDYNKDNPTIDLVNSEIIGLTQRIEQINKNKTVYLHLNTHQPWIYVAYSLQLSPYEFNETKREDSIEGWNNDFSFGRFYFELPEEINNNSIYVINEDDKTMEFIQKLIDNNYKSEQYKSYTIFYLPS